MNSSSIASHASHALLSERINQLAASLSDGVYERESIIKLCLLAALSGESVFLLGPPGIAKSLIAKRLIQAFDNSSYFEYLMTRFSTPEEVFGPLSIQELKDNGRYVRLTDGYLPTAQVVFLDEIWKAGPAILNTLLTVVNEKTFKNGSEVQKVPMRLLISASNELPDKDSGLDALYDRMLVRVFVNRIQDKQNFKAMLTVGTNQEASVDPALKISDDEYHQWQAQLEQLTLSDELFDKLYRLKSLLESETGQTADAYVSDRRWKKSVKLLKASAFFNGRQEINPLDLLLLEHCLWSSPESRDVVQNVMERFAFEEAFDQQQVAQNIDLVQELMRKVESSIGESLAMPLQLEMSSGLRKKQVYHYDVSQATLHQVGTSSQLVKLVLLHRNLSVSENEKGDSRWVYVPLVEFEKLIKEGHGSVYGYVNQNTQLCRLHFALDADRRLVIKDIANRSVLIALVTHQGLPQDLYQEWQAQADKAAETLEQAKHQVRHVRTQFHTALPHNFVESSILSKIESGVQDLVSRLETVRNECEPNIQRLQRLPDYFS
ncbi:ATPase RavA domain-containing protein [Vibrio palustris]|uniref:ATPase RavA n=1 Tax=Vibrio palustris TaxID=1918946 RepID=A0A1R4B700_9VIBR|nr:ATPase RavA domain-containing protein [Vibrio palustris]SJL84651.1 ATPase RavA [Vibrio palustris]